MVHELPDDTNLRPAGNSISSRERCDVDFDISSPIGLKNTFYHKNGSTRCANVCFFNSLIQILISIPTYRNYILETSVVDNAVVRNLKNLIKQIDRSKDCIDTYPYVHKLGIPEYEINS